MKKYKCMNIGNCDLANSGEEFEIAEGAELKCPNCHCGSDMIVEVTKKNWGKLIGIIAAVLVVIGGAVGAFFAFSGDSKPTAIKLNQQEITLQVGQKDVLTATAEPADAKATFTFKVSNGSSVEVSAGGEITAVKKGESTITVKCEENPELRGVTCIVKVVEPKAEAEEKVEEQEVLIEELAVSPATLTVKEGQTAEFEVAVKPAEHQEELTVEVDDEAIATVEGTKVTGVKAGVALVKVKSSKSGKEAIIKVTVEKTTDGGNGGNGGGGAKNPSWGRYDGQRNAQGLPHGNGVLRITRSTTINGQSAQPGERIEGVFRNGYVNMGSWYKNDGNVVVVKDLKAY